ncbi:hypothetical protein GCM10009790_26470 [Georgenia ruanii]
MWNWFQSRSSAKARSRACTSEMSMAPVYRRPRPSPGRVTPAAPPLPQPGAAGGGKGGGCAPGARTLTLVR